MKLPQSLRLLAAVLTWPGVTDLAAQAEPAGPSLGRVDFPVSCAQGVQADFNRAVALLHHMTYPEAREAFRQILAGDPHCAMAHWGVAMTLFQPVWPTRPGPRELQLGWDETRRADSLGPPTERERLYVAAAAAFFRDPASPYWLRIRRWELAQEALHRAFPDDPDATALYALALLASAPADTVNRNNADSAAALLLRVYASNPQHPGALHYLIHADDLPGREHEDLAMVRAYETVAPGNPHALHMPTHIYTRLGDWNAVVGGNLRAADAALAHPAGEHGELVWDEFPHALEYLIYAYLQQGQDSLAAAQLERLRGTRNLEPSFKTAFHLASTQARYALERRDWQEAATLLPREPARLDWDRFGWPEAVTRFGNGLGSAHLGDRVAAEAAAHRLAELEANTTRAGETLFARNIRVLRFELTGWIAQLDRRPDSARTLLRAAAELEAATPKHAVTPAPTLPALELLGDLLLEQRRPAEALAAYRESLEHYPQRFNSLLGAARAARAAGQDGGARDYYRALLDLAPGGSQRARMGEAENYVGNSQLGACAPIDSTAPWALVNRAWRDTAGSRWSNDSLRQVLLHLAERDQAARQDFGARATDSAYVRSLIAGDSVLAIQVEGVLNRFGLPTRSLVGAEGSDAFMLIVQHNWPLQERVLALAQRAPPGAISPERLAMLEDRVLVHQGKEQVYGTQFNLGSDGRFRFAPNRDLPGLPRRRQQAGLPPLDQYVCMLEEAGMRVDRRSLPAGVP